MHVYQFHTRASGAEFYYLLNLGNQHISWSSRRLEPHEVIKSGAVPEKRPYRRHGPLGRYMPTDDKETLRLLVDSALRSKDLLHLPVRNDVRSTTVQIHRVARDLRLRFDALETKPRAIADAQVRGDIRWAQRTVAQKQLSDGSTVAFLIAASMSKHKESTAQKYYNFNRENPDEHALSSRAYIEEFTGPRLRVSTEEDIRQL